MLFMFWFSNRFFIASRLVRWILSPTLQVTPNDWFPVWTSLHAPISQFSTDLANWSFSSRPDFHGWSRWSGCGIYISRMSSYPVLSFFTIPACGGYRCSNRIRGKCWTKRCGNSHVRVMFQVTASKMCSNAFGMTPRSLVWLLAVHLYYCIAAKPITYAPVAMNLIYC